MNVHQIPLPALRVLDTDFSGQNIQQCIKSEMLAPTLNTELCPCATSGVRTLTDFCKQDCTDVFSYQAVLKGS